MRTRVMLILLAVIIAGLSADGAFAQQPKEAPMRFTTFPEGPSEFGYVGPQMDISHIQPYQDGRGLDFAPAAGWDWRTMSGVTAVKNQNPYGTCWAFAALGNLEALILINESVEYDYSELNIQACNPTNNDCNAGGNAWMSTYYLSVLGTVDESCDTYPGGCPAPTCVNPACSYHKQVTEWRLIPNDVDAIKSALQSYGPVYTSMYASFPGFSSYDGTGCLTYSGTEDTNHGVLIVGWDDDLCGSGTGGWIVKNSWGTSWGDNGYFYITYGSARIGSNSNVITEYREYDPNMKVYYYDEWGWWNSVGYGDGHDYAVVQIDPETTGEFVHQLHFSATAGPTTYTISLYDDFTAPGMPTNRLAGPFTATATEAGYYTIDLPEPVEVTAGDPIFIYGDLNTGSYEYPIPYDYAGTTGAPMETNKSYIGNTSSSFTALDNGNIGMGDIGLRATIGPEIVAGECIKDGDPGFYYGFPASVTMVPGETVCYELAAVNFGWLSSCTATDTFCVEVWDDLGWAMTDDFPGTFIVESGYGMLADVCITAPCDATVGATNMAYAMMSYTDVAGVCAPDCGDCVDPNVDAANYFWRIDSLAITVAAAPPALFVLQDSLYYVEQGQTAAYVPFSICNGDPCAPPTDYDYTIVSKGHIGAALGVSETASAVPGGECRAVYGILDAGSAAISAFDTLTIIAWDAATGTVYDTCVQLVHVVEPTPVPLFSAPVITLLVLAIIAAVAIVLRRSVASRA